MGVPTLEQNYEPKYITIRGKGPVKRIEKHAKSEKRLSRKLPDREGEAIAWHLSKILEAQKILSKSRCFQRNNSDAVKESFKNPREIEIN
ncbi:hypothetical protein ACV56Z_04055 [Staphylococcus aureus]